MAKSQIPMPTGGSGIMPKLVSTVIGLAMLVLIVKQPTVAASLITGAAAKLGSVVEGTATFLQALG